LRSPPLLLPLGGGDDIGANCYFVYLEGTRILIDCGLRPRRSPGLPAFHRLYGDSLDGLWEIDAVILTHGHLDHAGGLPYFRDQAPQVPLWATEPTAALANLWVDKGRIKPLRFNTVAYGESFLVGGIQVTLYPAGHIPGAAMVLLEGDNKRILFSGDFSDFDQLTVPGFRLPESLNLDHLVVESTLLGRASHFPDLVGHERRVLAGRFAEVLERGGRILVPAAAVGRSQEIALILGEAMSMGQIPKVPVWVDGLAAEASGIYERFGCKIFKGTIGRGRKGTAHFSGPSIAIASSGSLKRSSRSYEYAMTMANHPQDAIFLSGHLDEDSPGSLLKNGGRDIFNRNSSAIPEVTTYMLSYHADMVGILALIRKTAPQNTILIHGFRSMQDFSKLYVAMQRFSSSSLMSSANYTKIYL